MYSGLLMSPQGDGIYFLDNIVYVILVILKKKKKKYQQNYKRKR